MRPLAEFRLDDGSTVELGPGDLIGRVASAALVLDDPRISEAHAMVSLRGGELYLLALRRLVAHRGKPVSEVLLETGSAIELADGISVTATRVIKPRRVQALRAPGLGVRALGQVASVVTGPPLRIVGRFVPGAAAHVWSSRPEEWRLREADRPTRTIRTGDRFVAAGVELELCEIALDAANLDPTVNLGGVTGPLRIIAHYEGVEIHRTNRPVLTIGGIGARLLSELVTLGGPVGWEVVARELWRDEADSGELRHRWDVALGRLRSRLRDASVRADLIRSDGGGQLQLVLYDGDHVDDRT
jgi:hypothetical protein